MVKYQLGGLSLLECYAAALQTTPCCNLSTVCTEDTIKTEGNCVRKITDDGFQNSRKKTKNEKVCLFTEENKDI